jgi:RNA polymerase sigma factor (sigma-70 family)
MDERTSLTILVATHAAALRLYACQLIDDSSAADDVVQEALVSLLTLTSPPPAQPLAWMYRVVRNAALDHLRAGRRRRERERRVAESRREWLVESPVAGVVDADAAQTALSRLTPEDREVVVLRIWGGLSFTEVGSVVHRSASTVHVRYEAALAQMRDALLPEEDPCRKTTSTRAK